MQVFIPFASFSHSVAVLDRARLGKQRMECRQILAALRAARHERAVGWSKHPATLAWSGYESALALYMTFCVNEWVARGYNNTIVTPYDEEFKLRPGEDYHLTQDARDATLPHWLGDEELHASHRAVLLRKDPEFYNQYGWTEEPLESVIYPQPLKKEATE